MKTALQLHYVDVGQGPVVVLLHGYLASSKYWQRVIDSLSTDHRVIALDLLGFGNSPKPLTSRYDYPAQIASITATLTRLNVTKPFTLIGHSMGSLVALRYASQHQTRVSKLVLANMPVFMNPDEARRDIRGSNAVYRIGLYPGVHDIVWPIFKLVTRLRLLPAKVAEGAANRRKYLFQSTGFSRLRSMRNIIFAAAVEADMARLAMQITLLSGLHDRERYLSNIATLQSKKEIVSKIIDGGHHLPLTHPELFRQFV